MDNFRRVKRSHSNKSTMLFGNLQIIKRDGSDGSHFPITSETLFGSDLSADVKLKVAGVAGRQCRIVPCPRTKKMQLEVLDDSFGETTVNGTKVSAGETRELRDADILTVTDRQFKLFYPVSSVKRQMTRTPGSAAKLKRRSIFNRTPPNLDPLMTASQKKQKDERTAVPPAVVSTPSVEVRTRRSSLSPKPRKSILSAKKNLLVARTPTMSPKVVTWGNNRYKSPESLPNPKNTVKMPRHTISTTTAPATVNSKKRSTGLLDETVSSLASSSAPSSNETSAGTPVRRRSASVLDSSTPNNSDVLKVKTTGTPLAAAESPALTKRSTPMVAAKSPSRQPASRLTTTSALAKMATAKSPAIVKETSPTRAVKLPGASAVIAGQDHKSNESDIARFGGKTRLSQSFCFLEEPTSAASPPLGGNLSMITQPSDSFGSLSVSDVDMSLFDSSMANDSTINATLRSRKSSSGSSMNSSATGRALRGASRSPKTPIIEEVEEDALAKKVTEEIPAQPSPKSSRSSVTDEFRTPLVGSDEESYLSEASDKIQGSPLTIKTGRTSSCKTPEFHSAKKTLRHSANSPSTEDVSDESEDDAEDEIEVDKVEIVSNGLETNQENTQPIQKTWAGVLKRSIASGSPFKQTKRKSLGTIGHSKLLRKRTPKNDLAVEIVAASSTGHALSPQTIFLNKKLTKSRAKTFVTPLSKARKSSLGSMTPDIETDMFVSPLKTPDNSEAISRASAFVANSDVSEDLEPHYLHTPGLNKLVGSPVRRSPRNSLDNEKIILQDEEVSLQGTAVMDDKLGTSKSASQLSPASRQKSSPLTNLEDVRGVKRLMTVTSPANVLDNFDGVKQLVQTPKVRKQGENSLDDVDGVKQLFVSPKEIRSPRNSLSNVTGVKKLLATPTEPKLPENNLDRTFSGVRNMVATPSEARSPRNDLDITFGGVKKLVNTPIEARSPKNDLDITFRGIRKLLDSPVEAKGPINDLDITLGGVKRLVSTPTEVKSPRNDLDITFGGVKKLVTTPSEVKSPLNNLDRSFGGVKRMFATPKRDAAGSNDSVLESVAEMMRSPVISAGKRLSGSPATSLAKRRRKEAMTMSAPSGDNEEVVLKEDVPMGKIIDSAGEGITSEVRPGEAGTSDKDKADVENIEISSEIKPRRGRKKLVQESIHSTTPNETEQATPDIVTKRGANRDERGINEDRAEGTLTEISKAEEINELDISASPVKRGRTRRANVGESKKVTPQARSRGRRAKKDESKEKHSHITTDGEHVENSRVSANSRHKDAETNHNRKKPRRAARGGRLVEEQESDTHDETEDQTKSVRGRKNPDVSSAAPTRGRRGQAKVNVEEDTQVGVPTVSNEAVAEPECTKVKRHRGKNNKEDEREQGTSRNRKIKSNAASDEYSCTFDALEEHQLEQANKRNATVEDSKNESQTKGVIAGRRGRRGAKDKDHQEPLGEELRGDIIDPEPVVTPEDSKKTIIGRRGRKPAAPPPVELSNQERPKRGKNTKIEEVSFKILDFAGSGETGKTSKKGNHNALERDTNQEEQSTSVPAKSSCRGRAKKAVTVAALIKEPEEPKKPRARGTKVELAEPNEMKDTKTRGVTKRPLEAASVKEAASKRRAVKKADDKMEEADTRVATRSMRTRPR